jgi:hypothetical protein
LLKVTVKINFNPDELIDNYREAAYKGMEQLMVAAAEEWRAEAGRKLKTTRRAYKNAVQNRLVSKGKVHLFLQASDPSDNFVVNALETGYKKFKIWPAVLAGRGYYASRKIGKGKREQEHARRPYVDIPFRLSGKEQGAPSLYRRMSRNNVKGKWIHPGFKPLGTGGLDAPLSAHVVEYVKTTAPDVFGPLLRKVTV